MCVCVCVCVCVCGGICHQWDGLVAIYKCVALWKAVYDAYATKIPLGTNRKEKGVFPVPGFYPLSIIPKLLKAAHNNSFILSLCFWFGHSHKQ